MAKTEQRKLCIGKMSKGPTAKSEIERKASERYYVGKYKIQKTH